MVYTWPLSKVWREQCGIRGGQKREIHWFLGKKCHTMKNYLKLSTAKVWFSSLSSNLLTHTCWGPVSITFPFPAQPLYVGHYLQTHILFPYPSSFADMGYSSINPNVPQMGLKHSQDPSGNRNAGECECEFPPSWKIPKTPPPFPWFCFTSHFAPSPSAAFVSKGFAWVCFLTWCWYHLLHSFFHGQ